MTIYDRAAATAVRMLAKFGRDVTHARIATGVYDPELGAAPQVTSTAIAKGAAFDYSQREINGTTILAADQRLLLSTLQTNGSPMPTPVNGDTFLVDAILYRVMGSRPLKPAGQAVLHDVQLRA